MKFTDDAKSEGVKTAVKTEHNPGEVRNMKRKYNGLYLRKTQEGTPQYREKLSVQVFIRRGKAHHGQK